MDKIKQYYQISLVKPEYHIIYPPFYKASLKRIKFNGLELELHYSKEFDSYFTEEELLKTKNINNENTKNKYNKNKYNKNKDIKNKYIKSKQTHTGSAENCINIISLENW